MSRYINCFILMCLIMVIIFGCAKGSNHDEPIILYVQYPDERLFMQQYAIEFESQYDNIKIYIMNNHDNGIEQPDIFYIPTVEEYTSMYHNGSLMPLSSFLKKDPLDTSNRAAELGVQVVQSYSDNTLYALPTFVLGMGLFYNKNLFDQYGIPYPVDKMSWEEVFELAQRFPALNEAGEPIYGLTHDFYQYYLYGYLENIAATERLQYFDPQTWKMNVQNPLWENILEMVIPAIEAGHVDISEHNSPLDGLSWGDFLNGHSAMIVHYSPYVNNIITYLENHPQNAFDWDIVSAPVDPDQPDYFNQYSVEQLFAINTDSDNKEAAWKLLHFIFNKSFYASKSNNNGPIVIGTFQGANVADKNVDSMFMLHYSSPYVDAGRSLPTDLWLQIIDLMNRELMTVVNKQKSISEALSTIEAEGQVLLDMVKAEMESQSIQH